MYKRSVCIQYPFDVEGSGRREKKIKTVYIHNMHVYT